MTLSNYIPAIIIRFVKIYLTSIVIFFFFRLILFFTEINRVSLGNDFGDIFISFLMGIRFDIVISGYILFLPYFFLAILSFFKRDFRIVNAIVFYYIFAMFIVAFMVCAVDIPYFNQFFARFSITAFEWLDSPVFVLKMIIQEPRYWFIMLPFFLVIYIFYKVLRKIFSGTQSNSLSNVYLKVVFSVLFLGLIFVGIRGRIEKKSPIRIGTAYFSNNAFLNQLGLNPNFTLIRSYMDSRKPENRVVSLMDNSTAIAKVQGYLNIKNPNNDFPIDRQVKFDSTNSSNYNVVLIIMEGMSAAKMQRHGNPDNLTPFLDSISHKGYYFQNNYSAGIHTFNGVFGSLFSSPALFRQNQMKESTMLKFHGLYNTLKENGYSTIYFTTHDGQFDNIEGFLKANDCEIVISKPDYPADMVKTTLGVPDDFMFEFSIPILNKLSEKGKPFFAAMMTASDHGPYYIPDYFKPKNSDEKKGIVEYADYSLRKFIELSSKQSWFSNTLFVFVADHGAPLDGLYDMSIDYNHVPLVFYSPSLIKEPKTFNSMAGQIDVFPSIMSLLKLPYINKTLGIDLFTETRPFIFANADDKYGVIDNDWFLIVKTDKSKKLYKYRDRDTHNYAEEKPDIVEKMNVYAQSNLQTFQYIILNKKQ